MTTEPGSDLARPNDMFGRALHRLAVLLAVFGGITLLVIVTISFTSILGRFLFSSPLLGDFELVEMGCAIAIASFLPLCQLEKGNVIVDFVTAGLSDATRSALDAISGVLFGLVAGFFTWRMIYGAQDMYHYSEETMLLQLPVWIPFLPFILSFLTLTACCFYSAVQDARHIVRRA
jgi:TRAP-type C4-dicarboxylate transport system permease small subunit